MARPSGRRVLPFLYLVPVSALCGALILLGFVVDRLPVLPRSVTRGYQRGMFVALSGLTRPVDGWMEQPSEPVAGGVAGESAP